MHKRILITVLFFALFPLALLAQTGKIAGKVTDRETGEPLIGANVKVEGASRGATTNISGEFVILNVTIGKVTLEASYVGYQKITIRDVLVRSGETTQKDFQLPSEAYKVNEVEIFAERPLVDKNVTNSKSTVTQEDIENLPVRGVENIVAMQAGVVSIGGAVYVRGSRGDATGYVVDGVYVNNPLSGGRALSVIQNSIAEVNFQAGGYSAEFGGANGGLINTTTRSGGRKLQVGLEAYTDAFYWTGWDYNSQPKTYDGTPTANRITSRDKALGTYSTGSSVYTMTVGGPLYGPVKFFVAGENSFGRSGGVANKEIDLTKRYDDLLRKTPAHSLLAPEEQAKIGIFDPQLGSAAQKYDVSYPAGYIANSAGGSSSLSGNLTFDFSPINLRAGGSYTYGSSRGGVGVTALSSEKRASQSESENYAGNLKMTHLLSNTTFYEIYLNYFGSFGISYDPDLKYNYISYGDSIANAQYGYQFLTNDQPQIPISIFGDSYLPAGYPISGFGKTRYNSIGGKINLVHQIGRTHEIKVGGEATKYTIRTFGLNTGTLWSFIRRNPDATYQQIAVNAASSFYGYDQWGNPNDGDSFDGPKEPVFAAFYALDKIELEDLVINVGMRYDYINTASKEFKDPHNVRFTPEGNLDPAFMQDTKASATVSPRLGFSFPVTDQTVFYAQYGTFVQQSRLRDVYLGNAQSASQIRGGYAISSPVGYGLQPERTTQYDFGFRQQIGEYFAFDIGAFYKDIRDQIQMQQITATPGAQHLAYYGWVNGDFATTSGVQLKFDLRRVDRITASVDYTYSDARGTGSNPSGNFYAIWQSPTGTPYLPKYTMPLDFDMTHRGSLNIDYRFGKDDGPAIAGVRFLERLGLNMLFSFNSGRVYTRVDEFSFGNRRQPVEPINTSHTPWVFNVDARIDKTVNIAGLDVNIYARVLNVLNIRNQTGVFFTSGAAGDNGYLSTEEGQNYIKTYAGYGDVFSNLYQDYYYEMNLMNAGTYSGPRQMYLGVRIDF